MYIYLLYLGRIIFIPKINTGRRRGNRPMSGGGTISSNHHQVLAGYDDDDVYRQRYIYIIYNLQRIKHNFPFSYHSRWDSPRKMRIVATRRSDFTGFLLVKTFQVLTVKACNKYYTFMYTNCKLFLKMEKPR